jgi:NAD(P)-dependent dehydrogenase (short-subunit alcohol dehydrogenase family)
MQITKDQVAVITGGGSGIGLALARSLAARGVRLVLADVDDGALGTAAGALTAAGAEVLTVHTDVSRLDDVEALAAATLERFGRVDLVVNNAGVIAWNPVNRLQIDEWRWVIGVNLWGVVHGVHVFLPILERQGTPGHLVNVSSVGGVLADTPFMATYSVTKAGVIGLSLTLAQELRLAASPVGVSILCPSNTADTHVLDAERNRPAAAAHAERAPGVDHLVGTIRTLVDDGQPVDVLAARTLAAVEAGDLWVFPHPDAASMLTPRLDALAGVLAEAERQTIGD